MSNVKIIAIRENSDYLDKAVEYFSSKWGIPQDIYKDCIENSMNTSSPLPRWYLMLKEDEIIGSYGLITNDFVSRQDLWPWLVALYVEESERGGGLGSFLLKHGRKEAAKLGFSKVYLHTDHVGYYEKYDWEFIDKAYDVGGEETRVYEASSLQ